MVPNSPSITTSPSSVDGIAPTFVTLNGKFVSLRYLTLNPVFITRLSPLQTYLPTVMVNSKSFSRSYSFINLDKIQVSYF